MSPRDHDNDPLPEIPTMIPDRDDAEHYQRQKGGKQKPASNPLLEGSDERYEDAPAGASKTLLYVLGALVVAALGWAGFLQLQLASAQTALDAWQMRVGDLEKRLSITDESANQSSSTLQVKLKELDESLVKVRDDNLKRAKTTLDQHTTQIAAIEQALKATQGTTGKVEKAVDEQEKTLAAAKAQLDKLAPTVELSKRKLEEQQAAIESLTEKGNVTSANVEKLGLRMNTSEEWVQSINNFRKQTNREIVNIKQQIGGPVSEAAPK
ncbi:MAG: hypothetical protein ABW049_14425 [Spongiibacteraceae bacterium]